MIKFTVCSFDDPDSARLDVALGSQCQSDINGILRVTGGDNQMWLVDAGDSALIELATRNLTAALWLISNAVEHVRGLNPDAKIGVWGCHPNLHWSTWDGFTPEARTIWEALAAHAQSIGDWFPARVYLSYPDSWRLEHNDTHKRRTIQWCVDHAGDLPVGAICMDRYAASAKDHKDGEIAATIPESERVYQNGGATVKIGIKPLPEHEWLHYADLIDEFPDLLMFIWGATRFYSLPRRDDREITDPPEHALARRDIFTDELAEQVKIKRTPVKIKRTPVPEPSMNLRIPQQNSHEFTHEQLKGGQYLQHRYRQSGTDVGMGIPIGAYPMATAHGFAEIVVRINPDNEHPDHRPEHVYGRATCSMVAKTTYVARPSWSFLKALNVQRKAEGLEPVPMTIENHNGTKLGMVLNVGVGEYQTGYLQKFHRVFLEHGDVPILVTLDDDHPPIHEPVMDPDSPVFNYRIGQQAVNLSRYGPGTAAVGPGQHWAETFSARLFFGISIANGKTGTINNPRPDFEWSDGPDGSRVCSASVEGHILATATLIDSNIGIVHTVETLTRGGQVAVVDPYPEVIRHAHGNYVRWNENGWLSAANIESLNGQIRGWNQTYNRDEDGGQYADDLGLL